MIDITDGEWTSSYTLQSDGQEPHTYEHQVVFTKTDDELTAHSLPRPNGSELVLRLRHDPEDRVLTGTWAEKTSPNGIYRGAIFHGALQFIMDESYTRAHGKWVGFNDAHTKVKTGDWYLHRKDA